MVANQLIFPQILSIHRAHYPEYGIAPDLSESKPPGHPLALFQ